MRMRLREKTGTAARAQSAFGGRFMVEVFTRRHGRHPGAFLLRGKALQVRKPERRRFIFWFSCTAVFSALGRNGFLPLYGSGCMAGRSAEKSEFRWYHGLMFALSVTLGAFFNAYGGEKEKCNKKHSARPAVKNMVSAQNSIPRTLSVKRKGHSERIHDCQVPAGGMRTRKGANQLWKRRWTKL